MRQARRRCFHSFHYYYTDFQITSNRRSGISVRICFVDYADMARLAAGWLVLVLFGMLIWCIEVPVVIGDVGLHQFSELCTTKAWLTVEGSGNDHTLPKGL